MPRLSLSPPLKSGSILIVSLWAVAILSILSMTLANFVFQQIRFANFFMRSTVSVPLAKAACLYSFYERKQDQTPDYDTAQELKRQNTQTLCGNLGYKYYFVDKRIVDKEERIIDESALININVFSSDMLQRLPGLNEDLAKRIVDSPRRPFRLKEELLLIEGIDKDRLNKFKDLITVYGNGKININTAPSEVLSALGVDDDLIRIIMRYRQEYEGIDGKPGTEDDGAFTNSVNIVSDLKQFTGGLSSRQERNLLSLMDYLTVKSAYLRLNILTQIKGKAGNHYSIVIYPEENKILSWSEQ